MIKKLFIATIIFLGLLTPVSSFAMEFTLPEIYSLGDLGYGLAVGAQWDFTDKDDFLIQNIQDYSPGEIDVLATQKVRYFLEKYAINRGIPYAEDGQVYDNPKDYLVSTYFNKSVTSLYQKYQQELAAGNVNADATLRMPISRQRMTDWSGYRIGITQRYYDSLAYGMDIPDTPVVNPPAEYISFLDFINKKDNSIYQSFWFYDFPNSSTINSFTASNSAYPLDGYSWVVIREANANVKTFNDSVNYHQTPLIMPTSIRTLNIYSIGNDLYSFSDTVSVELGNILSTNGSNTSSNYLIALKGNFDYYSNLSNYNGLSNPKTYSIENSSLTQVFNYIIKYYKNVNIYVDGEPWSLVSDPAPADPLLPDFPDVIYTDYGPVETIDLPATPDNNGTFDITSLFDAIKEAIIGASDTDPDTDGTLGKEGVTDTYRDTDGELTGEEDIPLEDAIDDSFPIEDTSNYPDIILPYEPIHNAFMGTTVLAQLINATQTVLPEELILVFWGIVFILFIIGLIKILHK